MMKDCGIRLALMAAGVFFAAPILAAGASTAGQEMPLSPGTAPLGTPAVIQALSIGDAQRLLQAKGYRAEQVQGTGTPYLKSQTGGSYFFLSLYDCADPVLAQGCTSLEFTTGAFSARPAPTGEELARWNAENWWGFGVFDPTGAPYLRSYISLSGGVTKAHLNAMIELWDWRVNEFTKFIQAVAARSAAAAPLSALLPQTPAPQTAPASKTTPAPALIPTGKTPTASADTPKAAPQEPVPITPGFAPAPQP